MLQTQSTENEQILWKANLPESNPQQVSWDLHANITRFLESVNPEDLPIGWWFGYLFYSVGNVIIPIDELIFFRGVGLNHQPVVSFDLVLAPFFMVKTHGFRWHSSKTTPQAEDEAAEVLAAEACVEVSKWPGAQASRVITDGANWVLRGGAPPLTTWVTNHIEYL